MSSIQDALLGSENQSNIKDLAQHLGIDEKDVSSAIKSILPSLSGGLKKNLQEQPGRSVLNEPGAQETEKYITDDGAKLYSDEAVQQGNSALGSILGEQNSHELVGKVASVSGIPAETIQKLLPMVTTMLMGSVSKQVKAQGSDISDSGTLTVLAGFLDQNKDGNVTDDLLRMVGKFFSK